MNNKSKKRKTEFEFCKVCNRNHDQGNKHKYFPNHKKSLPNFINKFHYKLSQILFFIKNPSILRVEHAPQNRFWCMICDLGLDEVGSFFACENAIRHLGSDEHLKNVKHFLWENGGDMNCIDRFRVLEDDIAKWEKKCEFLKNKVVTNGKGNGTVRTEIGPLKNIHNELKNEKDSSSENCFDPIKLDVSNSVMPLHYFTNEYQISGLGISEVVSSGNSVHVAGPSVPGSMYCSTSSMNTSNLAGNWNGHRYLPNDSRTCSDNLGNGMLHLVEQSKMMIQGSESVYFSQALPNLTRISTSSQNVGGNVHTGAPPPWFETAEETQLEPVSNKRGKSHKLNPKRVGAAWAERRKMEIEMEKRGEMVKRDFDADWLPNFGRVWQSGSRKESRKEYEKEKQKLPKADSHSEMPVTVRPYISKRMQMIQMNDDLVQHGSKD